MSADQIQQQDAAAQPQSPLQDQQQQQQERASTPDAQQDSTPSSSQIPLIAEETQNVASIADGGRELSKTVLYVGNIHRSVADETLQDLFSSLGNPVKSLKILQDKNRPGFNYAFVEYESPDFAEHALHSLDGTSIADNQLKITKAFQTQQVKNSDTFNLFIGDLSLEVNDEVLNSFFQKFPSLVQANVMWDMKSGRSRGYGFVCFDDKKDAEEALQTMNGYMLGDRPIRLNWASHRDRHMMNNQPNGNMNSMINRPPVMGPPSYEMVLRQAPSWLSAVYLGNLADYTTQNDLIPLLQNFGYIVNFKLLSHKGYAFVTYDTHERAAMAIVQLSGFTINGRPLKCGWGKSNKVVSDIRNISPDVRIP
ncbi:hypothetical protein PICMEDRAFT_35617 [Pichia membranifaciens NRRL Y-2026]|uniref:RRM domain-containing protein n=1 Tax=Pichia membranifaciens NRRL Y-2026 TaxID=763406 RepID=A0A1E3NG18_9ASCO|nr:hypothetical protein PICMEDRAFT_35617 [Pichia membranifaciens NRRL Y-2026]ODQ45087.1 hypothetical protein PICMEDRAFT_35617 [Pichia membranifaciens NRRL Y-2026]